MIWIVDHGLLHEAVQRWAASKITFTYLWFDTDLSTFSNVDELTSYYLEDAKKNSPTSTAPELNANSYQTGVIKKAWSFAHEIKVGDYAVLGCMGTMHVGRITGPYAFDLDSRGKGIHSYPIAPLERLVNKFHYPRELRGLFGDTGFGKIDDPRIEKLLERAVAGDELPDASAAHLMFEEMLQPDPNQTDIGDLALDFTLEIVTAPEFCEACQRVCTEVVHMDNNDGYINHPDGHFVPWSALSNLREDIQSKLDDEVLERAPGESDLTMVRRYVEEREDRGSYLAAYNLEAGYPLLFGLRRDGQEVWAWIGVSVDRSGYDASMTGWVFPSRELAEPYFHKLGFHNASDIDAARLIELGFEDPEGQHLKKASDD